MSEASEMALLRWAGGGRAVLKLGVVWKSSTQLSECPKLGLICCSLFKAMVLIVHDFIPSILPSVCPSIHPSYPLIKPPLCPFIRPSSSYLNIHPSVHPFIHSTITSLPLPSSPYIRPSVLPSLPPLLHYFPFFLPLKPSSPFQSQ